MGRGLRVAEDGRFEIRTLRPGTVRVRVHRSNVVKGEALLDFPDVQVVAGMISRDPRLQEMRPLRDVKPLIVTVRDSGGAPVRGAQVSFRADGTKRWSDAEPTGPDGTTRLVGERGRSALRTVVVCGRGFRPAELDGILEDVEFALLPATESTVRLRLAADVSLPSAPFHLTAELHWFPLEGGSDDEIDPRDVRRRARLSSERLVELTSVRPGRYRVALMLHETHRSGAGVGWDFPTVPEDVVVTVPGDGSDVDVWVGIDPAKLRERTSR